MKTNIFTAATTFLIGNVLLGSLGPLTKYIFDTIPLNIYLFPKYFFPGVIILAVMYFSKRYTGRLSRQQYRQIIILALLNVALTNLFYYMALEQLPAIYVVISSFLYPAAVYMLSIRLLKEQITIRALVGVVICLVGAGILVIGSHIQSSVVTFSTVGIIMLAISVLANAYGTVLSKPYLQSTPLLQLLGLQLVIGSLVFVPQFAYESLTFNWAAVPWDHMALFVAICFVLTPLGNIMFYAAIKRVSVSRSAAMLYASPVAGIVIAATLLGEVLTPLYIGSVILIMIGVWHSKASIFNSVLHIFQTHRFQFITLALVSMRRGIAQRLGVRNDDDDGLI